MHELSIAENIIKIVRKDCKDIKGSIKSISVSVGELTGIVPQTLIYIFNIIKEEYGFESTELIVNIEKCEMICENCGTVFENYKTEPGMKCESCGSDNLTITGGDKLKLLSIETSD